MKLADIQTPELILDQTIMRRNIERMTRHCQALGVPLRPHLKTPKSLHIAQALIAAGAQGFNVSTMHEAEYFHACGLRDLYYCVPFAPQKAQRAAALIDTGCHLTLMTDTLEGAEQTAAAIERARPRTPARVTIEIDVDGYRSGIRLEGDELERAAEVLARSQCVHFAGIMSYAGASYGMSPTGARVLAARHCDALGLAAQRLKAIGLTCDMISLGSTPAVLHSETLLGITEARCGILHFRTFFRLA